MKILFRNIIYLMFFATVSSASFLATHKHDSLKIYENPSQSASLIGNKKAKDKFTIEYCNKYKWCKLEDEEGFVKEFQIQILKIKDLSKKKILEKSKKKSQNSDELLAISYKKALNTFKNKDFDKSFIMFENLFNTYPTNKLVDFYYGRSAFELKNYEYAFSSFDRILINNPNDVRVRAEFARTLMMMKSYKEAKKEFETVLLMPIPVNVRKNINKLIKVIDSKEKTYIFNKVAIFGFGWDNNVENNTYLDVVSNGLTLDKEEKKEDSNFHLILVGNLIVPNKTNEKFSWETTAITYTQEQNEHKNNNIQLLSLSSGIGYTNKNTKNLFSLTYDHIWVGGAQTLYVYGLADNFKYKIDSQNIFNFDIKIKNKKFSDEEDFDKNSRIKEFSIDYSKILKNKKDKIVLLASYITERKREGTSVDVNKNTSKYKISYTKEILKDYDITLSYQKEFNRYLDENSLVEKRSDDKKTYMGKINYKISKTKILSLEYNNNNNKSNNNAYSYKKQTTNLNYIIIF